MIPKFTFSLLHKVTSRRSYMLLGCFQEKKKITLWGSANLNDPIYIWLLSKSYWVFLGAILVTTRAFSAYTLQGTVPQDPIPPALTVTHCTVHFWSSVHWTCSDSSSTKCIITEKYLQIRVIHWNQCQSGDCYSSECSGDKRHTCILKPGFISHAHCKTTL